VIATGGAKRMTCSWVSLARVCIAHSSSHSIDSSAIRTYRPLFA
jgi:hypothetical protein